MQVVQEAPARERATEVAYQRLSDAVIRLELAPGEVLNERGIAARLGVTRLTMIPALHRLAETGLIEVLPRRGIVIAPVNVLDVQQVFQARTVLEGELAALTASRATSEQLEWLRSLAQTLDDSAGSGAGFSVFLEHDRRLHLALAQLSGNRYLYDALERVWKVNLRLWHLFFRQHGTRDSHFLPHSDLISALAQADGPGARVAMVSHIAASKELLQLGLWGS